eukprot:379320_1
MMIIIIRKSTEMRTNAMDSLRTIHCMNVSSVLYARISSTETNVNALWGCDIGWIGYRSSMRHWMICITYRLWLENVRNFWKNECEIKWRMGGFSVLVSKSSH